MSVDLSLSGSPALRWPLSCRTSFLTVLSQPSTVQIPSYSHRMNEGSVSHSQCQTPRVFNDLHVASALSSFGRCIYQLSAQPPPTPAWEPSLPSPLNPPSVGVTTQDTNDIRQSPCLSLYLSLSLSPFTNFNVLLQHLKWLTHSFIGHRHLVTIGFYCKVVVYAKVKRCLSLFEGLYLRWRITVAGETWLSAVV